MCKLPETQSGKILFIVCFVLILIILVEACRLFFLPCKSETDLIFMLDSSGSVNDTEYAQMLNFTENLIKHDNVYLDDDDGVQVAVAQFSDVPKMIVNITYDDAIIKAQLQQARRLGFNTDITAALDYVANTILPTCERSQAKHILIFMTDGRSDPPQSIEQIGNAADKLKELNTEIFSIEIGQAYLETEIWRIASGIGEKAKYVYAVESFNALTGITDSLGEKLCTPNYWLLVIPIVVLIALFILIKYLDWREVRQLTRDAKQASQSGKKTYANGNV